MQLFERISEEAKSLEFVSCGKMRMCFKQVFKLQGSFQHIYCINVAIARKVTSLLEKHFV
jgi:hypothetical protein